MKLLNKMQGLIARRKIQRNGLRGLPSSAAKKNRVDDHLINWLWAYALLGMALVYGCEYVYWSTRDAAPLQVTREIRR